jgi:hypothetical protein
MSDTHDTPAPPTSAPLSVAAPMLDYACNQKGCCCKGWLIPFMPSDVARMAASLPEEERNARLGWGLQLHLDADTGELNFIQLARTEPNDECRFLEDHGTCELHRRFGPQALPDLCVAFPVTAYQVGEELELHYEALCPSVLDRIADPRVPYQSVALDATLHPQLAARARSVLPQPLVRLGELALGVEELRWMRQVALRALGDTERPAIEHLSALSYAFDKVRAQRDVAAFELRYDEPLEPFYDFLEYCARIHASDILVGMWTRYRRFVWDFDRDDPRLSATLEQHLDAWEEPLSLWMADAEVGLRPLLVRYLAHRYHSAFTRYQGEVMLSYGSAPLAYALSIRLAAALSGVFSRATDVGLMKAALGWSEYTWRGLNVPAAALPWFTPYSAPGQLFSFTPPEPPAQDAMDPGAKPTSPP